MAVIWYQFSLFAVIFFFFTIQENFDKTVYNILLNVSNDKQKYVYLQRKKK